MPLLLICASPFYLFKETIFRIMASRKKFHKTRKTSWGLTVNKSKLNYFHPPRPSFCSARRSRLNGTSVKTDAAAAEEIALCGGGSPGWATRTFIPPRRLESRRTFAVIKWLLFSFPVLPTRRHEELMIVKSGGVLTRCCACKVTSKRKTQGDSLGNIPCNQQPCTPVCMVFFFCRYIVKIINTAGVLTSTCFDNSSRGASRCLSVWG